MKERDGRGTGDVSRIAWRGRRSATRRRRILQERADLLHVFPDLALAIRAAQQDTPDGTSGSASRRGSRRRGRAAARSDRRVRSSVCAANLPSATITFGLIDVDLPEQERLARLDLVRLGVAVAAAAGT